MTILSGPTNTKVREIYLEYNRGETTLPALSSTSLEYGDGTVPFDTDIIDSERPLTTQLTRQTQVNCRELINTRLGNIVTYYTTIGLADLNSIVTVPPNVTQMRVSLYTYNTAGLTKLTTTVDEVSVDITPATGWTYHDFDVYPGSVINFRAVTIVPGTTTQIGVSVYWLDGDTV